MYFQTLNEALDTAPYALERDSRSNTMDVIFYFQEEVNGPTYKIHFEKQTGLGKKVFRVMFGQKTPNAKAFKKVFGSKFINPLKVLSTFVEAERQFDAEKLMHMGYAVALPLDHFGAYGRLIEAIFRKKLPAYKIVHNEFNLQPESAKDDGLTYFYVVKKPYTLDQVFDGKWIADMKAAQNPSSAPLPGSGTTWSTTPNPVPSTPSIPSTTPNPKSVPDTKLGYTVEVYEKLAAATSIDEVKDILKVNGCTKTKLDEKEFLNATFLNKSKIGRTSIPSDLIGWNEAMLWLFSDKSVDVKVGVKFLAYRAFATGPSRSLELDLMQKLKSNGFSFAPFQADRRDAYKFGVKDLETAVKSLIEKKLKGVVERFDTIDKQASLRVEFIDYNTKVNSCFYPEVFFSCLTLPTLYSHSSAVRSNDAKTLYKEFDKVLSKETPASDSLASGWSALNCYKAICVASRGQAYAIGLLEKMFNTYGIENKVESLSGSIDVLSIEEKLIVANPELNKFYKPILGKFDDQKLIGLKLFDKGDLKFLFSELKKVIDSGVNFNVTMYMKLVDISNSGYDFKDSSNASVLLSAEPKRIGCYYSIAQGIISSAYTQTEITKNISTWFFDLIEQILVSLVKSNSIELYRCLAQLNSLGYSRPGGKKFAEAVFELSECPESYYNGNIFLTTLEGFELDKKEALTMLMNVVAKSPVDSKWFSLLKNILSSGYSKDASGKQLLDPPANFLSFLKAYKSPGLGDIVKALANSEYVTSEDKAVSIIDCLGSKWERGSVGLTCKNIGVDKKIEYLFQYADLPYKKEVTQEEFDDLVEKVAGMIKSHTLGTSLFTDDYGGDVASVKSLFRQIKVIKGKSRIVWNPQYPIRSVNLLWFSCQESQLEEALKAQGPKDPSMLPIYQYLLGIAYSENNLTKVLKPLGVSLPVQLKLLIGAGSAIDKQSTGFTQDEYDSHVKICAEAFLNLGGSDESALKDNYESADESFKRKVAKRKLDGNYLQEIGQKIAGDGVPIKPIEALNPQRIAEILKYNNITIPGGSVVTKAPSWVDLKVRLAAKLSSLPKINDLAVSEETKTPQELRRMAVEYDKFNRRKHGQLGIVFNRVFNVNIPLQQTGYASFMAENPGTSVISPAFHGTGATAASMILRNGFRVLKAGATGVVGRMLGDGIYFSNVLDKVGQYVSDAGYSRGIGQVGYIFEMDAALGKKGINYQSAGVDPGDKSVISPEWCVFDGNRQLKIKKAYLVKIVSADEIDKLKTIVESEDPTYEPDRITLFESFMKRASIGSKKKGATTFIFMDGTIPVDKHKNVDFERYQIDHLPGVRVEISAHGPMVIIDTDETETFAVASTREFMSIPDRIDKFLRLTKKA